VLHRAVVQVQRFVASGVLVAAALGRLAAVGVEAAVTDRRRGSGWYDRHPAPQERRNQKDQDPAAPRPYQPD